jgi:hypothetical protein
MSGEDSTFIQAAEELTRDLVGAEVQTISGLLDYLEVVDRAGFAAMVEGAMTVSVRIRRISNFPACAEAASAGR